jgi:hypothetical protein
MKKLFVLALLALALPLAAQTYIGPSPTYPAIPVSPAVVGDTADVLTTAAHLVRSQTGLPAPADRVLFREITPCRLVSTYPLFVLDAPYGSITGLPYDVKAGETRTYDVRAHLPEGKSNPCGWAVPDAAIAVKVQVWSINDGIAKGALSFLTAYVPVFYPADFSFLPLFLEYGGHVDLPPVETVFGDVQAGDVALDEAHSITLVNAAANTDLFVDLLGYYIPDDTPGVAGPAGARGEIGPQGEQGRQGQKGDQGEKGVQGIQGVSGDPGAQGPKGDPGATGATGVAGPKGDKGDAGDRGLLGPAGPQGEAGPKGDKGDPGAAGIQGPQGVAGVKGDTGAQGPAGIGLPGPVGPPGQPGANGKDGKDGADGACPQCHTCIVPPHIVVGELNTQNNWCSVTIDNNVIAVFDSYDGGGNTAIAIGSKTFKVKDGGKWCTLSCANPAVSLFAPNQ